jgi:monovalent cation/hydrogen antiporter
MERFPTVALLLAFVAALAYLAQRTKLSYPILMVLGGLVIGFVPGLPRAELGRCGDRIG